MADEEKKVCFAVTPIGEEGSDIRRRSDQVLRYIIEPVMTNLKYETVRADGISQPGMITNQVIEHLIEDDLVVADLTSSNPNVFYELAIRHATRKPVVTLIEMGERIPFDVSQSRTIQFTYRDLDSVEGCKTELKAQVRALEANPTDFFTPVSVAIDLKAMYESGDPEERRDAQVLAALQEVQAEMSQLGVKVARLEGRVAPSYIPRPTPAIPVEGVLAHLDSTNPLSASYSPDPARPRLSNDYTRQLVDEIMERRRRANEGNQTSDE